jgi:hypothetical protein
VAWWWWWRRRREQRAAARAETRDNSTEGMKNLTHTRKRAEKETRPFFDPAYICLLTDKYRRACNINPAPPYIHRFPVKTDEYNLNIFVSTNEFKNLDE